MVGDENTINDAQQRKVQEATQRDYTSIIKPMAAGIGAIALGSVLLRKRIAEGGEVLSELFNFLGFPRGIKLSTDIATNVGDLAPKGGVAGIRSILDATFNVRKNSLQLGPLDLIDDVRAAIEVIGRSGTPEDISADLASRVTELVNRKYVNNGLNSGYFTKGLQRVTVGNVLEEQAKWSKLISEKDLNTLRTASDLGILSKNTLLDKKLFLNTSTNELLDFRLRNMVTRVAEAGTDAAGNPILARVPRFDLFGQARVIESIFGSTRSFGVINSYGNKGTRFFIGGSIISYEKSPISGKILSVDHGGGFILKRTDDPLEVIAASRAGALKINVLKRTGTFGRALSFIENLTGIGPSFATRPSILNRLVIDPIKRAKAIHTGIGVIVKAPYEQLGSTKGIDAVIGANLPELINKQGIIKKVPGGGKAVGIEAVTGRSSVVIPNRIGVFFDLADNYSVVSKEAWDRKFYRYSSRHLVVPHKKGGYSIVGREVPSEKSVIRMMSDTKDAPITSVGYMTSTKTHAFYATTRKDSIKDFAAYMLYRINNLASESLLGIGFKPSHKITANAARLGGIMFAYEGLLKGAEYADYLVEDITGISPVKTAASAYAGLRVLQQKLRSFTGIQQISEAADTYFPGSINSEGATLTRSIIAPAAVANLFLKKGSILGAALGALSTYLTIGGPDPGQTAEDLEREYSGEKKVPVRTGAFWALGYMPFFGGKVERYDTSWYAKIQSDYRTKGIYGSKEEYWKYHANVFGIPFPTIDNLFGLRNITNPYRLEQINYASRPYPQTASALSSFPIIGPALDATIGQLIKPRVSRTLDQMPLVKASLAPRGVTEDTARMIGIGGMNATSIEAEDPSTAINVLKKQANIASEPLGVYKFVMEFFGVSLKPDAGTELATSAMIDDPGRYLYDLGLGGALGNTEFIRRFLLSDYSSVYRRSSTINPIANDMPSWLPGQRSESLRDKDYFIDFTYGDPYVKIADGEARLPGKGYEALNPLHSGKPGEYSDVDRFLILSDVAPYSNAYKKYEKKVAGMTLDPEWRQRVDEAIENRKEVLGVDTRYKRYEEDIEMLNMNTIASSIYAPLRRTYDTLTHDVLAEIPVIGSKLFPFRSPYEQYRKMHVEGSPHADWSRPYEAIIRPALYDVGLEDPATAGMKGAVLGMLASGPLRWFSPVTAITAQQGVNMATVGFGAAAGMSLSLARISAGYDENMLPHHIQQDDEFIKQTDAINFIRNKAFASAGVGFSADMEARKTMFGAMTPIEYRASLPNSSERRFFDYFLTNQMSNKSEQLGGLPEYMSFGLQKFGNNKSTDFMQSSQTMLAETLSSMEMPDSNWLGWNPMISNQAVRLKYIDHGVGGVSENMHRFGFFESHEIDLKTRLASFNDQDINFVQTSNFESNGSMVQNNIKNITNKHSFRLTNLGTPNGRRYSATVKLNRNNEYLEDIKRLN